MSWFNIGALLREGFNMTTSKTITGKSPVRRLRGVEVLPSTDRTKLREALVQKGIEIDDRQELAVKGPRKSARHWAIGYLILVYLLQLFALISSIWKRQVRRLQIKQIQSFVRSSGTERIDFAELSCHVSFLDKGRLHYLIDELQQERALINPSKKGDNWELNLIGGHYEPH